MPEDSAAASPPLEPPVVRPSFHGFSVLPKTALSVSNQNTNSGTLVCPRKTAPASFKRVITTASASGTWSSKNLDPRVVRSPPTSTESFAVNGTPCNGPRSSPRISASSASRAWSMAVSSGVTMALSFGLTLSMRERCACITSVGETDLLRICSASSVAGAKTRSSLMCVQVLIS